MGGAAEREAMANPSDPTCLSQSERSKLVALVRCVGERAVAVQLSLSRLAVCRACAGLPLRRATVALVRAGLRDEVRA